VTAKLDDLVLQLKGLVLVRELRQSRGADDSELQMYRDEIDRLRNRLAELVKGSDPAVQRGNRATTKAGA
jgi:hypothetical protein